MWAMSLAIAFFGQNNALVSISSVRFKHGFSAAPAASAVRDATQAICIDQSTCCKLRRLGRAPVLLWVRSYSVLAVTR